jgi:hypothetical protein
VGEGREYGGGPEDTHQDGFDKFIPGVSFIVQVL